MSIHDTDLHSAASMLRDTPGVVAVDVFGDNTKGVRLRIIMAPEYDGVPALVTHILADYGIIIKDVSTQGDPTHYILTAK